MSKTGKLENNLDKEIELLKKEELTLFNSYNRHESSEQKLKILNNLSVTIIKLKL